MLASVFEEGVDTIEVLDCIALGIGYEELYRRIKAFSPTWVIFNPISSTFTHDMIVAHYAKAVNAKTAIISPLAEHQKEEVYERFPTLDHIIGYGDEPERLLFKIIKQRDLQLRFQDFPASRQDLLPIAKYNLPFIGRNYTFVIANRGCPWKCIYCRQTATWRGKVRYRSVESVINEISRFNLKNIAFHSDTFTVDKEWVRELCRRMPPGVRWVCNSRVDTVDEALLHAMRRAGCWMICYGIESGNDEVLSKNRKGATCEQATRAVKDAKSAGLKVWGYFMLGLYGDTARTMEETIQFATRLPLDIVNFSVSAPYHGTEWHRIAEREGWLQSYDWESYDQNYSAPVSQPGCPSGLVSKYQARAYRRWATTLRGFRFGLTVLRSWGLRRTIKVACEHLWR
jgi:radical SAM superfamily enzyme YgiQ (UPF0313 family)